MAASVKCAGLTGAVGLMAGVKSAEYFFLDHLKERKEQHLRTLNEHLQVMENEYRTLQTQIDYLDQQIESEEKEMSQSFRAEREDTSKKIIVTLGMTGGGKSTLCNRLKGDESIFGDQGGIKTSSNGKSCTQNNEKIHIQAHDVAVVDTPGFGDSFGRDRYDFIPFHCKIRMMIMVQIHCALLLRNGSVTSATSVTSVPSLLLHSQHSNRLCAYLKGCGGINTFVLVRNGANVRFDQPFQNMLKQYHEMFGQKFFERLIIVATHIEGFIKMRYEQNNQENVLREDICNFFNLRDLMIPVIPIGFEEYKESIEELIGTIFSDREQFEDVKAPIDDLRTELRTLRAEEEAKRREIEVKRQEIEDVEHEEVDIMQEVIDKVRGSGVLQQEVEMAEQMYHQMNSLQLGP